MDYYTYVSATLERDEEFERWIIASWRFPERPSKPQRVQMETDAEMLAWHAGPQPTVSAFGKGIRKVSDLQKQHESAISLHSLPGFVSSLTLCTTNSFRRKFT